MSYSVNPSAFKSIFAVPADVVDKHIRLANEHQLKVLLWILRNSPDNPDINLMCKDLKIAHDDALDYLQYWILTGVLSGGEAPLDAKEEVYQIKAEEVSPAAPAASPVQPVEMIHSKPSSSEIAQRLDESPEIGHLFNEAQQMLGKTIGYDGQCTLLLLHDHYGLPTEVLFMLIEYCVSIGKTNYGYIEAVGKDWGSREIDTMEKAAEQINSLKKASSVWKDFAKSAGISNPRPTTKQISYLRKWSEEWKFSNEMIILAYEEMANHTGKLSFAYIDKVLSNWHKKEIKTSADFEKESEEFSKKKQPAAVAASKNAPSQNASYDIDEFKNRSLHGELKYERKKKK